MASKIIQIATTGDWLYALDDAGAIIRKNMNDKNAKWEKVAVESAVTPQPTTKNEGI